MGYLIGIDLGTSSIKALIIDFYGNIVGESNENYEYDVPMLGYAEQNPIDWWNACCRVIRDSINKGNISAEDIKGLGFSGQMHGGVFLDENYNVIRPAILHCDSRSLPQTEYIKKYVDASLIQHDIMNPIYPGFLLTSLLWVRDNEPLNFKRIKHVCFPKDYLKFKMTGKLSTDYSDASASLAFNVRDNSWNEEVLNILGVNSRIFPNCSASTTVSGTITGTASVETGLSIKTVVAEGGGDQLMQSIGNGVISPGDISSNIGSSGQLSFQTDKALMNPRLSTNTFCGYEKGRWFTMGAIMSAGLSLKWCNSILQNLNYSEMDILVRKSRPGSGGLLFLPSLNGERTPYLKSELTGGLLGINMAITRDDIIRSVMEGVTYALKQCMDICEKLYPLNNNVIVASGGGARSSEWLQIQSDIFNKSIIVSKNKEQACLGAAICAGVAIGQYSSIADGCRSTVRYEDNIVCPNADRHNIYMGYYEVYKKVYNDNMENLINLRHLGERGV